MDAEWNLQFHLEQMEGRIREDIQTVGKATLAAQEKANEAHADVGKLGERTAALESNLKWLYSGIFSGVFALVAFVWHIIVGKP